MVKESKISVEALFNKRANSPEKVVKTLKRETGRELSSSRTSAAAIISMEPRLQKGSLARRIVSALRKRSKPMSEEAIISAVAPDGSSYNDRWRAKVVLAQLANWGSVVPAGTSKKGATLFSPTRSN